MQRVVSKIRSLVRNRPFRGFCRVFVSIVFIYTGIAHLKYPFTFEEELLKYNLLPIAIIPIFAQIMPWIEVIAGSFFLVGIWRKVSGFTILGLLILYIGAIGINIIRGVLFTDCGCVAGFIFPSEIEPYERLWQQSLGSSSLEALLRDIILSLMTLIALAKDTLIRQQIKRFLKKIFRLLHIPPAWYVPQA